MYQFSVACGYFAEALDIFAQCFHSPLLRYESAARELSAIQSEFSIAAQSDGARLQQLLSSCACHASPLAKFSWGNMHSLRDGPAAHAVDVNKLLRQMHEQYYTADNAQLVVAAPIPIALLKSVAYRCFEGWINELPSRDTAVSSWPCRPLVYAEHITSVAGALPFERSTMPRIYKIVPMKQMHKLSVTWQLPPCVSDYRSKAHLYYSHLIGHEGTGSVLWLLKRLRLAASLSAGIAQENTMNNSQFALFAVSVTLTAMGIANWVAVVHVLYAYLRLLRDSGPQRWVFDELKAIADLEYGTSTSFWNYYLFHYHRAFEGTK